MENAGIVGNQLLALSFLDLAIKYFILVENVYGEIIRQGNAHLIVSDEPITSEKYHQQTRWSDFNIIEPTLFCQFHGFELVMKGLIILSGKDIKPRHSLRNLLDDVRGTENISEKIKQILVSNLDNVEIQSGILGKFLSENALTVDDLYEALRYPTRKDLTHLNSYLRLHYKERSSIDAYKTTTKELQELREEVVKFYRTKE